MISAEPECSKNQPGRRGDEKPGNVRGKCNDKRKLQMTSYKFTGELGELIEKAEHGSESDVDYIMSHLTQDSSLAMTRYVDYALGLVENPNGIKRLEHYLFNGTVIQRNYSSLFFNRRLDYDIIRRAFKEGRIDEIQAFAR